MELEAANARYLLDHAHCAGIDYRRCSSFERALFKRTCGFVVAPRASTAAKPIGTPSGPGMPETPTAPTRLLPLNIGRPPVIMSHGVDNNDVRALPSVTFADASKLSVSVWKRAAVLHFIIASSPECPSEFRTSRIGMPAASQTVMDTLYSPAAAFASAACRACLAPSSVMSCVVSNQVLVSCSAMAIPTQIAAKHTTRAAMGVCTYT